MNDQSAFSKKKLETINIEKRDWMEELNLPPQLIKFLRQNTRALQIGGILLALLFIAYNGGQFYLAKRLEKSTVLLDQAIKKEDTQNRKTALTEVVAQYGGTDAGLWARIELAQLAHGEGDFDAAITYYGDALDEADGDNSIVPLLEYGLASAYEQKQQFAAAAEHFNKMREFKEYERQAWLGLGRISEKEGHTAAAINAYEKVLSLDEGNDAAGKNDWLAEKVRFLKGAGAVSAVPEAAAEE